MSELKCHIVADLLPLYSDRLLSPETEAAVATHLRSCDQCRRQLQAAQSAAQLPQPEEVAHSDEDRLATEIAGRLRLRTLKERTAALWTGVVAALIIVGLIYLYWRALGWLLGRFLPISPLGGFLALLLVLVIVLPAAQGSFQALNRLGKRKRRWALAALAGAVTVSLFYQGLVPSPKQMLFILGCPGGESLRSGGAVVGWYRAPDSPLWSVKRAYRLEAECENTPGRYLRWVGVRSPITLESGELTEVSVTVELGRPASVESVPVEGVLATWQHAPAVEAYYLVRLSDGTERTLILDLQRGTWREYDRWTNPNR